MVGIAWLVGGLDIRRQVNAIHGSYFLNYLALGMMPFEVGISGPKIYNSHRKFHTPTQPCKVDWIQVEIGQQRH